MKDINELIDFVRFTHEIRLVERAVLLESDHRKENDMEHMYQLALTALYLIEKDRLKLDKLKVLSLALLHDIVEAYAGDIPTYSPEHSLPSKAENERLAAQRLKREWPEFKSLHTFIKDYEERKSDEAKFVYALDKLIPVINNYIYDGRIWKKVGLDLKWLKSSKVGKVNVSSEILDYYQQMLKILDRQPELFRSPKQ